MNLYTFTAEANINTGVRSTYIAITPDGNTGYVSDNHGSSGIVPITFANSSSSTEITFSGAGNEFGIVISPNGQTAYVASRGTDKLFYVTLSNKSVATINCGSGFMPQFIRVTPDGTIAYIIGLNTTTVVPVRLNNMTLGIPINIGCITSYISMAPNGLTLYVSCTASNIIMLISPHTETITGNISIATPGFMSITPDGTVMYITSGSYLYPISLSNNSVGSLITTATIDQYAHQVSADGSYLYAKNVDTLRRFAIPSYVVNSVADGGVQSDGLILSPDQAPTASYTTSISSKTVTFNGVPSSTPWGFISTYMWTFGDTNTTTTTIPIIQYTYSSTGTYTTSLTVTNSQGTSTATVYTGISIIRNGGPTATSTQVVVIV